MEPIKALMRLGERVRKVDFKPDMEITPETILKLIEEVNELRRWAKHIQIEVDDLREKVR